MALPKLIRDVLHSRGIYDAQPEPNPISRQNIPKLRSPNQLEKYIRYALGHSGDAVLLVLDCDEHCPLEVATEFSARIAALNADKKVGISLFNAEFETLFVCCIDSIAEHYPEYGWKLGGWDGNQDHERM